MKVVNYEEFDASGKLINTRHLMLDPSDLPGRLNPYDAELSDIDTEGMREEIRQATVIEFYCPDGTVLIWKHPTKKLDSYYNARNGGKSTQAIKEVSEKKERAW